MCVTKWEREREWDIREKIHIQFPRKHAQSVKWLLLFRLNKKKKHSERPRLWVCVCFLNYLSSPFQSTRLLAGELSNMHALAHTHAHIQARVLLLLRRQNVQNCDGSQVSYSYPIRWFFFFYTSKPIPIQIQLICAREHVIVPFFVFISHLKILFLISQVNVCLFLFSFFFLVGSGFKYFFVFFWLLLICLSVKFMSTWWQRNGQATH